MLKNYWFQFVFFLIAFKTVESLQFNTESINNLTYSYNYNECVDNKSTNTLIMIVITILNETFAMILFQEMDTLSYH